MSRHHLNTQQTGDIQLSLFGDHKPVERSSPAPASPASSREYDPHQLALLVNPTEHIKRMRHSGDLWNERYDPHNNPNPAPTKMMQGLWQRKESESREEEGWGHGGGLYDIIASGEQIREPIQVFAFGNPERDQQYEGHHRVAAGHAVERDTGKPGSVWLPIKYHDRTTEYGW